MSGQADKKAGCSEIDDITADMFMGMLRDEGSVMFMRVVLEASTSNKQLRSTWGYVQGEAWNVCLMYSTCS
jgi:hypothetical protein